jgi:HEAT repeat protein
MKKKAKKRVFLFFVTVNIMLQLGAVNRGSASETPIEQTVQIGRPARPYRINVIHANGKPRLAIGRRSVVVPLEEVKRLQVEIVELANNGKVAVVRMYGSKNEQAAAVVTKPKGSEAEIAWIRRLDVKGDPGERAGELLEVRDRNGDGIPEVVVGRFREGLRICGESETILNPKEIASDSLALLPVRLQKFTATESIPVIATRQSPGPTAVPLVKTLTFTAASSQLGANPLDPAPSISVSDGLASTLWIEEGISGASGEFITARREASAWPIKAFAFIFSPDDVERASKLARPKRFWIVSDDKQQLEVQVPEDPGLYPGERFWVVPPKPLQGSCVSIVLEESYPAKRQKNAPTAIAEVEAYTDLDFGGGIARLIAEIVGDTALAADAAQLLAEMGEPAASLISQAWERMSPLGRHRAVRVFGALAKTVDEARSALSRAARERDESISAEAIDALARGGVAAAKELIPLAKENGSLGDRAALALVRAKPQEAVSVLLDAFESTRGTERPILREALARAIDKSGEKGQEQLVVWLKKEHSVAVLTSVTLAISPVAQARPIAEELIDTLSSKVTLFQERWRLVQSCVWLPARPHTDTWLAQWAQRDPQWMLRVAALKALSQRKSAGATEVFEGALKDQYPRVRVAALGALVADTRASESIAQCARNDDWPLVRAAAMEALGNERTGIKVLIDGVNDPAKVVRATAIRVLARLREGRAWQAVQKRLQDGNEWPDVTTEAIAYAKTLCIPDAAASLKGLVDRGLAANAWLADMDVAAIALETLGYIGGPQAVRSVQAASSAAAPPALQAAAKLAAKYREPCKP